MYLIATYSFWIISRLYSHLLPKECSFSKPNVLQPYSAPESAGHLSWIDKLFIPAAVQNNYKMQLSILVHEEYKGHVLERLLDSNTEVERL